MALAAASPARAEWRYARVADNAEGSVTVSVRNGATFVSARQFCFALGCSVFYQWASHRAVIQNKTERTGAIVSSLTSVALVEGHVVDFDGEVVSDEREGYLLPLSLAVRLAGELKLGKITERRTEIAIKSPEPAGSSFALKTIVLDPGHGGNDMGTGFGSIYEKDVTLVYAMRLRDEIMKALPDVKVILTREDDRYVSLPDRAKLANSLNANLFLSIHLNHATNPKVEGTETYILSPDATDDDAKRTALLENDTWLKSAKIGDAGNTIRSILVDMEQTKYIQNSALVASMIHQDLSPLGKTHGLKTRGVKQAMFYVLSQVAMPSTLVEMGFLSNTGDRSRMMNVLFRDDFVSSLVAALKRYADKVKVPEKEN
ncbi:MAG: N-acetylmuramoyl-L-alanine amidase [Deltaproteobacteria bacterium]|nr:N-acetylmuramoyl-L-alanine amidase [Deltaproteobacteria bacterium]